MSDLKPGTLCWMTDCQPQDVGKVVKVEYFEQHHYILGDVYWCTSRDPITIASQMGNHEGIKYQTNFHQAKEFRALRKQLIPINDPGLSADLGAEAVSDQLKSLPLTKL